MSPFRNALFLILLTICLAPAPRAALAAGSDQDRIDALEKRVKELEELVRHTQPPAPAPATKPAVPTETEKRLSALEEKASQRDERALAFDKIHFHGYGDIHYNNPKRSATVPSNRTLNAETDVHRLVLGAAYDFSDAVRADFEAEWEHGGAEIEVEYAFLEMDLKPGLSFRAGSLLMPFGPLNEFHEPTNYYSVQRPYVETYLVPTSWQEIGAGLAGRSDDGRHAFRAYLVTGLTAANLTAAEGLHDVSSKGKEGAADDLGLVARYETSALPIEGLRLGFSGYHGEADQSNPAFENVGISMAQADFRYRRKAFELLGSAVTTKITHADELSVAKGETVGDRQEGWYGEMAYHLTMFEDQVRKTSKELVPFLRHERFDTHASVPGGFMQGREYDRQVWTTGLAFFPTKSRDVVIKADVENWRDAGNATGSRFNLGVGFTF